MNHPRFFRRFAGLVLAGWLLLTGSLQAQSTTGQRDVLREITDVVGLKPRFELRATTEVQNAAAVVYGGKRYLLYNPQFVAAVNRAGRTDWAGISILAHEMGHHLNGHTLRAGGSNPADELEADEFSGFVLRKMGASLAQAQAGMAVVSDDEASPTHPGRRTRLTSIGEGWQRANQQIVASTRVAAPSAAPAVLADRATAPVRTVATAASPVSVLGKITFRDNPDQFFYLTNRLSVVRVDPDDRTAQVVGRLTRSESTNYPYVLVDGQQRRLYISRSGGIFDTTGRQVAMLSDPS
ncbi:membrane-binding protein [Hymenobacter sp. 5516J-16]|uniref:Membrane-binding protein n=1 Tax=Hymenobacter sublimis TaxID=2933777 RepID=A0ABY4J3W8_9BACT|nr:MULTISPECIES: membrane-binding protein [Hymenobacter]UOQ77563.1 membrane-binding protein [Hymenobacter sp. 5516J-16]UPL47542.1 membrane-binding protein [Hymenobacter sublimis]